LPAGQIDKIEVVSNPDAHYDASAAGVINIGLKKSHQQGVSGYMHAELPVSQKEVYLFPAYRFQYNNNKFNVYTSYNGELIQFDQLEREHYQFDEQQMPAIVSTEERVRQHYYSHRFHYGVDVLINARNQLNYYGFVNPFSQELDGTVLQQVWEPNGEVQVWKGRKDDENSNRMVFHSLFYKHLFDEKGHELAVDCSLNAFKGAHHTSYTEDDGSSQPIPQKVNETHPRQQVMSVKIDYARPIAKGITWRVGVKRSERRLEFAEPSDVAYKEDVLGIYSDFSYAGSPLTLSGGLRVEESCFREKSKFTNTSLEWLPHFSVGYRLSEKITTRLAYRCALSRPDVYQLSPDTFYINPYALSFGNPMLQPTIQQEWLAEVAYIPGKNYWSARFFILKDTDVMDGLTHLTGAGHLQSSMQQVGDHLRVGLQLTAALKLTEFIDANIYLKGYQSQFFENESARQNGIQGKRMKALETGLSMNAALGKKMAASIQWQYNTPRPRFQGHSYSDAIYFIALERSFNSQLKAGVTCALPFAKTIDYNGRQVEGPNFQRDYLGRIEFSTMPLWFKITYRFSAGKKRDAIKRQKDIIDTKPKGVF